MPITRWDPFRELRRSLWHGPDFLEEWELPSGEMAVDVYETDNDVIVETPMAGINPDDVDITITGDTVTIKGETKEEKKEEDKKRKYYYHEIRHGACARSVTLPAAVKTDQAKAEFKDGMLKLTLPKKEEAKPKQVKVQVKK